MTRKAVCRAGFSARISPAAEERSFDMELSPVERFELPDGVKVSCWPVMLPAIRAIGAFALISGKSVIFDRVTLLSLTSFFAFKVIAEEAGQRAFISFALNLPVQGMPEERTRGLLQHIIGNSERFVRYLLFLLADNPEEVMLERIARGSGDCGGEGGWSGAEIPLLEEMVRAYSRHPEKLERVEKLVTDLKTAEGGAKVSPKDLKTYGAPSETPP